jgi:DUF971 family protein
VAGRRHVGIMKIQPVGNYAIRYLAEHELASKHALNAYDLDILGTLIAMSHNYLYPGSFATIWH